MSESGSAGAGTVPAVQVDPAPGPKGGRTRARLLDTAYARILEKGFAATSIEELVAEAGITKSGFFYHFRDKNDLARQLLQRYLGETEALFDQMEARARQLSEDPLHGFLIFLRLFAEALDEMLQVYPGCLVSSITYQDRSFDGEVRRLNREGVLAWRSRFRRWLEQVVAAYPPRIPIDVDDLAVQMSVIADGSIIHARALDDPKLLSRQALLHREMIRLLFLPGDRAAGHAS